MNPKRNVSYVLFSVALIAIISACSASQTEHQPSNAVPVVTATSIPVSPLTAITAIAPTTAPTDVATPTSPEPEPSAISPAVEGNQIAFNGISFAIPSGMANGAHNEIVPQTLPNEPMFVWPQHTKIVLQGYVLQSQNQPQILIFPVNEYETMSNDPAASQYDAKTMITTLQNILSTKQFPPEGYFPFLPDQHAAQVFHVQEKILSFQNGNGIRYITQFSQAHYPAIGGDMLYTFQGITNDGKYYVSVILPIQQPQLLSTPVPENDTEYPAYLAATVAKLNQPEGAASDSSNPFAPSLASLDHLAQSLIVSGQ